MQEDPTLGTSRNDDIGHTADNVIKQMKAASATFNVTIDGEWGAGKTRTANEIIEKVKSQWESNKLFIFHFDLLPFGNIGDSVSAILSEISRGLWLQGVVDIRTEMERLISDAQPTPESNVGLKIGPLSFSRKVSFPSRRKEQELRLQRKLEKITQQNYRIVIVLDDLDRLKPSEMTIILRLVERLRQFPGMIVFLPYYRDVVAHAIGKDLDMEASSTRAFLRKFKGELMRLEPDFEAYAQKFQTIFQKNMPQEDFINTRDAFGMSVAELAWYAFIHHMVLIEMLDQIGDEPDGNTVAKYYPSEEVSPYFHSVWENLSSFKENADADPYAIGNNNEIQPFARVHPWLVDDGDARNRMQNLHGLLNKDILMQFTYLSPEIRASLSSSNSIPFNDPSVSSSDTKTVFTHIFLPLLSKTKHESMITRYYTLRDMEQIASMIATCKEFSAAKDDRPHEVLDKILSATKQTITNFR